MKTKETNFVGRKTWKLRAPLYFPPREMKETPTEVNTVTN